MPPRTNLLLSSHLCTTAISSVQSSWLFSSFHPFILSLCVSHFFPSGFFHSPNATPLSFLPLCCLNPPCLSFPLWERDSRGGRALLGVGCGCRAAGAGLSGAATSRHPPHAVPGALRQPATNTHVSPHEMCSGEKSCALACRRALNP